MLTYLDVVLNQRDHGFDGELNLTRGEAVVGGNILVVGSSRHLD